MKVPIDVTINEIDKFWLHPELDILDDVLRSFKQNPHLVKKFNWLKLLRESLGLTAAGLAEKLNVNRRAISQFEESEINGTISIKTLAKIVNSLDCDLVYTIVPKKHSTFSEMVTAKTLAYVLKPDLPSEFSQFRKRRIMGSRIKMFLSQPTGRGQIWGLKKALKRPYSWLWADSELAYHPHGQRASKRKDN